MSFLGTVLQVVGTVGTLFGQPWGPVVTALGTAENAIDARREAKRQRRRQIDAFNAQQIDRIEMLDPTPDAARTLCMGLVRNVEGVRRWWTSGENQEKLTMVVSFAGHQIDSYVQWYLDDLPVSLDAAGWVTDARWSAVRRETVVDSVPNVGTTANFQLPSGVVTGTVLVSWGRGTGEGSESGVLEVAVSVGGVASISGIPENAAVTIAYQTDVATPLVRIRPYLGAAGQNVGADIAAEYPGKITGAAAFAGIACAVVDVVYNADIMPGGRPTVAPVFKGALCYDPRKDSTVGGSGAHRFNQPSTWQWSSNPALCALRYATWAHGFGLEWQDMDVARDVVPNANACDVSTAFNLRKSPIVVDTVTLPRYECGFVAASDADPGDVMDEIMESMAGRQGWAGGVWRFRAGAMAAPAFDITPDWLAAKVGATGEVADADLASLSFGTPIERAVTRISGRCYDDAQRFQLLPFPAVEDAVLSAKLGGSFTQEVEYQAVHHVAHAQHLASIAIRQAQAPLQAQWRCNLRAYQCEVLDVCTVNVPGLFMAGQTHEVTGWAWSPDSGVALMTAEIAPGLFVPLAELTGRDPAPNSIVRSPWEVEALQGLTAERISDALDDRSMLTRVALSWTRAQAISVLATGRVEIQYWPMDEALPAGGADWSIWEESGGAASAVIPALRAGRVYLFRARFVQMAPLVRGRWSAMVPLAVDGNGLSRSFRAVSVGLSSTAHPVSAGLYEGSGAVAPVARSYAVHKIRRSDGKVVFAQVFDVYGAVGEPEAMAAALNATDSDHIVVVLGYDEPKSNRLNTVLAAAMYRCGASRAVFGSPQFKNRGAYVLVGVAGCGEGQGAEGYQGKIDNDANAWCEISFQVRRGELIASASATPRDLTDYGFTGDLNANRARAWHQPDDPALTETVRDNDTWLDSDDGDRLYTRVGGGWVTSNAAGGGGPAPIKSPGTFFAQDATISPQFASAAAQFHSDGTIWTIAPLEQVGTWFGAPAAGVGAAYQISFELVSSAGAAGGNFGTAVGSWQSLATNQAVIVETSEVVPTIRNRSYVYRIRETASSGQVASGTLFLEAAVDV